MRTIKELHDMVYENWEGEGGIGEILHDMLDHIACQKGDTTQAEVWRLRAENADLRQEIDALNSQNIVLRNKLTVESNCADRLRKDLEWAQKLNNELDARCADAEGKLSAIKALPVKMYAWPVEGNDGYVCNYGRFVREDMPL